MTNNQTHRWSGWPGAFCMLCRAEDQTEICLGEGCEYALKCECGEYRPAEDESLHDTHKFLECPIHKNDICPHYIHGQDPYDNTGYAYVEIYKGG